MNAPEGRVHGPATQVAIHNLQRLKPEHRALLQTVLADAGIGADTLEAFVEHLLEEEGPALQQIVARTKLGIQAEVASIGLRTGTTVGDLRGASSSHGAAPAGMTVGSLRR